MKLTDLTWPDVDALNRDTPVIFPVAALEQHGRHMPVFTDSLLMGEIARRTEAALGSRALFAPLQWLGNSHHHMDFPGTLSAEPRVYLDLLCGLLENFLAHGFKRLLILNGHGGNDVPGKQAVFEVRQRHRDRMDLLLLFATYWNLDPAANKAHPDLKQTAMGHACEWETSMVLRLNPPLVKGHGEVAEQEPGTGFEPASRGWTMRDRSVPGHIGNPREASVEKGEALFATFTRGAVSMIERMIAWDGKELGRMSAPTDEQTRSGSWKWWITGILLLATTINYMDRVTLSNASVRVTSELGLNEEQYGRFELFFGWAFGIGSITFGFLADRWRVYFLYPSVLLCWSLMGIASGLTHDYTSLIICRTLLGFFEAGHWPCALKTTFALLNEKDRTMGNSVLQSGASIGAIITPQIMRMLVTAEIGSWRFAFVAVGVTGLLWLVLWFACLRPRDLDVKSTALQSDSLNLKTILRSRRFWALALLIAGMQPAWHIPRVWLMKFLHTGRGYAEATVLNFTSAYYIATDIGCMLAGAVSMWLIRRWSVSPHDAKLSVYAGACLLTSTAVFIPFLGQGWLLLATLLLIGAGALAMFPCYYSFTQEISPKHLGRVTGLLGLWVWIATSPMHTVFGVLYDRTKSYDIGIVVACLAPWIGVLSMRFLWQKDDASSALLSSDPLPPCPEKSPS